MTFNATTSAITARDFSQSTLERDADRWTIGKMRHLIAALGDRQVLITVEARTGHTIVGRLLEARDLRRGGMWCPSVLTEIDLGNGEVQRTWRDMGHLGTTIIEVPVPGTEQPARWAALTGYTSDCYRIIAAAKVLAEAEGITGHASWTVDHHGDFANVERLEGKAGRRKMWKIEGRELAEATA